MRIVLYSGTRSSGWRKAVDGVPLSLSTCLSVSPPSTMIAESLASLPPRPRVAPRAVGAGVVLGLPGSSRVMMFTAAGGARVVPRSGRVALSRPRITARNGGDDGGADRRVHGTPSFSRPLQTGTPEYFALALPRSLLKVKPRHPVAFTGWCSRTGHFHSGWRVTSSSGPCCERYAPTAGEREIDRTLTPCRTAPDANRMGCRNPRLLPDPRPRGRRHDTWASQ